MYLCTNPSFRLLIPQFPCPFTRLENPPSLRVGARFRGSWSERVRDHVTRSTEYGTNAKVKANRRKTGEREGEGEQAHMYVCMQSLVEDRLRISPFPSSVPSPPLPVLSLLSRSHRSSACPFIARSYYLERLGKELLIYADRARQRSGRVLHIRQSRHNGDFFTNWKYCTDAE